MSYRQSLKSCVLATSSAAVIGAALAASAGAPALAQETTGDRVVVTGSRILRRDFVANSPIVTVDTAAFESQQGLNIESYLNRLPQFNPAASPVTTEQDVQVTAVNSTGIATISLRGLGANRNLVLVDGRRTVPVNALGVTDINAIPSALIQRVEIITGGASAVYGADAVGGVVNFILRDNFDGLELDTQYGITEVGDGEEFRVSAVMGTNFASGRGNVTFGVEHYSRSAAYENERDWQREEWADPLVGSGDFFVSGVHGFSSEFFQQPSDAAISAIFGDRPAGTEPCPYVGTALGIPVNAVTCAYRFGGGYSFNADGSIWQNPGGGTGLAGLENYTGPLDGLEFALQTVYNTGAELGVTQEVQALKWNNTEAYISAPQDRYSFFGSGTYDITDSLTFFARATFAESKTKTRLFPSPAIGGWEANIPYNPTTDSPIDPTLNYGDEAVVAAILANPAAFANPNFIPSGTLDADGNPLANHPVSVELAVLLNSRHNPFAPPGSGQTDDWQLSFIPTGWFPDRSTVNTISAWNFETGFRGEIPFRDWTWEAYLSHGESNTYNIAYGNFSLERFRAFMEAPDYGRNAELAGNLGSVRPGFGIDPGTCTSGFYDTIFNGDVSPSEDCIFDIAAPLQTRTQIQQNIGEVNVQGGLFDLPAGEVRGLLGFQYRELNAQFIPDILQSTRSFLDQVVGVYPAAPMDASTHARDYFGELVVPVLSDLPFIQQFELELGARWSDYEESSNEWTYKILGTWQVNDWLRFRGGYNRSTRAPNIGELFLGRQIIFSVEAAYGDPCGIRSQAPYGAGGAQDLTGTLPTDPANNNRIVDPNIANPNPPQLASGQTQAGANSTALICQAQMESAAGGSAQTWTDYYTNNGAGGGRAPGFFWNYQEGNPNLESEVADTWTAGFVFNSPWQSPWLSGLSLSVDWYQLKIKDAIQFQSVDYVRALCYGSQIVSTAAEAAARAASPECQAVPRLGGVGAFGGGEDTMNLTYDNSATIESSGVDVALNWMAQFEDIGLGLPGGLGLNVQATWLDYYRTRASDQVFDVETDWAGTQGPTLAGTTPGAYDYRLFTTLNYFVNDLNFSLRWRHLPSVWGAGDASEQALIANNLAVAGGAEGAILTFTPGTQLKTSSYDVFDLSFNWDINETFSLRGGINNLFDKDPPRSGRSAGRPIGSDLDSVCDAYGGTGPGNSPGPLGCVNPTSYSLPNPGTATAGFYDVMGRSFFIGAKARF